MRILKKSLALFLALTMVLSIIGVSVFAAPEDYTMRYVVKTSEDGTTSVSSVKAGKTVYVDVYVKAAEYLALTVDLRDMVSAVTLNDVKVNVPGYLTTGLIGLEGKQVSLNWNNPVTVTDTQPIATIKLTIPSSATVGENTLFTQHDYAYSVTGGFGLQGTKSDCKINVAESFNVNHYSKAYTAGIGTSAETIITALGDTATAYEKEDETTGKNAEVKVGTWTAPADFNADDTSKTYEFTAPVLVDENADSLANVTAKQTARARVTLGKIDLATDTAVTTDAPSEKDYMLSKTAGDVKVGTVIAGELPTTVKIKKGDKYEEEATVAWAVKEGPKTELKLDTLTSADPTNIVTLVGTITPNATNTNYSNTKTVECVAKVVPAEVAGGGFTVKTASKNGYGKVSVTVPKESVVAGKEIVATMTSESFASTVTTPVTAKYTFTEADRTAAAEAGTFTTTLKFDKTFGKLGLDTNKKYKVSVTVDGAALLTKEGDKEVKEVEKKVSAQASSGGSSSNPSSPIIVNKYDVKVTAGENGTATAEPTKAAAGDKVTVKAVPAEGFKVKNVVVKDANGNAVEVDAKTYTFTMPKGAVTVEVTFEEGKDEPVVEDGKFTDVPDTFWAAADIYTLKEAGIINGKSDKEFDPEGKVTRAEFTKMIVNLFGVKASQNTVAFTDCKADDWFTPFVAAAVEAGYVKGITDTEFAPDKTITREEACTILGRAYAKTSDKALNFKDASEISDFAAAYVALLVDMGYLNGYEDGTFLPKNEITRAEAAKIIASAFRAAEKAKTEVTEDKTEAKDNADADVKADDKTDAKADDKAEVKADDKTDAKADAKTEAKTDAKTDAKADNGEKTEK